MNFSCAICLATTTFWAYGIVFNGAWAGLTGVDRACLAGAACWGAAGFAGAGAGAAFAFGATAGFAGAAWVGFGAAWTGFGAAYWAGLTGGC